jgi:hypothetical protein
VRTTYLRKQQAVFCHSSLPEPASHVHNGAALEITTRTSQRRRNMDGLSLAASVIAVIQLAGSCLKLSRKFLGPSEFGSSDLNSMTIALYGFNGAVKSFQTYLEIYEDDEVRLSSLEHLKPALKQCREALRIIEDFIGKSSFIGKHVIGPRFDCKLKTSLKALDEPRSYLC